MFLASSTFLKNPSSLRISLLAVCLLAGQGLGDLHTGADEESGVMEGENNLQSGNESVIFIIHQALVEDRVAPHDDGVLELMTSLLLVKAL